MQYVNQLIDNYSVNAGANESAPCQVLPTVYPESEEGFMFASEAKPCDLIVKVVNRR